MSVASILLSKMYELSLTSNMAHILIITKRQRLLLLKINEISLNKITCEGFRFVFWYTHRLTIYSSTHVVQIMDFLDFLNVYCKEKSETCTKFYTSFVVTKNLKISFWPAVLVKNQHKMLYHRKFTCKRDITLADPWRKIGCSLVYKYRSWEFFLGLDCQRRESISRSEPVRGQDHLCAVMSKKCQTEGFDWQNFIRTDNNWYFCFIFYCSDWQDFQNQSKWLACPKRFQHLCVWACLLCL